LGRDSPPLVSNRRAHQNPAHWRRICRPTHPTMRGEFPREPHTPHI
jgi:hypothetical protein